MGVKCKFQSLHHDLDVCFCFSCVPFLVKLVLLPDCLPLLLLSLLIAECASRPLYTLPSLAKAGTKKPLQTSRPFNVAHRGANGEFPEETAPAYMVIAFSLIIVSTFYTKLCPVSLRPLYLFYFVFYVLQRAIEEGADFIESDILSTKDGVLICHHDVNLDDTTDVADHKEFADRKRTYEVQGMNMTGFFTGKRTTKYKLLTTPFLTMRLNNFQEQLILLSRS